MINVIVTGASGMVGEGVLIECIRHDQVDRILVVGRRPCGVTDPKVREILVKDFFDLHSIEPDLKGYNACFFCLGVSSVGMKEPEYRKLTYDLTMNFANLVSRLNPGMTFCYVSGASTDSSEKGRSMWARVKGNTENDLMKLPFKQALAFRPGVMHPTAGMKNTLSYYKYFAWIFYLGRPFFPTFFLRLSEVGRAMINSALFGSARKVLETRDIYELSRAEVK
jgi:uncharacterized protein YbjT (DUF2867 family)